MGKKFQLTIAEPCHENWDSMTPTEKGKFCAACQKQVVDFTGMSDSQLATFFKRPGINETCGRFYNDQLDRNIEIHKKRIPWIKYFFQFALPAFLVSMKATAQGKVRAQISSHEIPSANCGKTPDETVSNDTRMIVGDTDFMSVQKQNNIPASSLITIKGKVIDESNVPVSYASILVKGTKMGTMADSSGSFSLTNIKIIDSITLEVSCVSFKSYEMVIKADGDFTSELILTVEHKTADELVLASCSVMTKGRLTVGAISMMSTTNQKKPIEVIEPLIEAPTMIKVYPNPVLAESSINVGCQKLEAGYYDIQLHSQSGQQVMTKQTWIDEEIQVLNIEIPRIAAGIYFLKLTNSKTKKRFTQKILVE